MSPGQARGRPVDKRTDVWAFGAVLYEMLTRQREFPGEDLAETIASVVKSSPDWTALPADVPPQVVLLIQRCLEKDKRTRIGDIAVARLVSSEHATIPARSAPALLADKAPVPRWRQAMPWVIAAVGFITAAASLPVSSVRRQETASSPPVRFFLSLPPDLTLLGSQNTTMPAVSPDGRRVAFVAARGGVKQIWIRPLDALEAQPVFGTEDGSQMFWSPDSRSIGFSAAGKLKIVEVRSGLNLRVACQP